MGKRMLAYRQQLVEANPVADLVGGAR
jgi:hypothetical protein